MRPLRYIELKSGHNGHGPAWIALVDFSRSGTTVYFNDRALMRCSGVEGNHVDIETGEEYWISGVKKDGRDRYAASSVPVAVDSAAVAEYLALRGLDRLDPRKNPIVSTAPTRIERFAQILNAPL